MNQYIITITSVDDGEAVNRRPVQTIIQVATEDGRHYIRELTVKVPDGAQLTPADLLAVELLAGAFAVRPSVDRSAAIGNVTSAPPVRLPAETGERAYRRMPDPAVLKAAYLETRSITGVAARFQVPTYTAQGWISRLRRKGVLPTAG